MIPSEERIMRRRQSIDACRQAEEFIRIGNWEGALYHLDESRHVIAALEFEDRMEKERHATAA